MSSIPPLAPEIGEKRRGNAGKGRPKGAKNKATAEAKHALDLAFQGLGGVDALLRWARKNRAAFYTRLWVKRVPQAQEVTGTDGGPITVRVVRDP